MADQQTAYSSFDCFYYLHLKGFNAHLRDILFANISDILSGIHEILYSSQKIVIYNICKVEVIRNHVKT